MRQVLGRLEKLEQVGPAPTASPPIRPQPTPALSPRVAKPSPVPPSAARQSRPSVSVEDLLGGRVLGWVGGIAVVLGVVFFLVMAANRGWIDETTRVLLAFVGATALLVTGLYLHERQGRTQAALAAVATAIA